MSFPVQADRFIPNRSAMNFESGNFALTTDVGKDGEELTFTRALAANLLPGGSENVPCPSDIEDSFSSVESASAPARVLAYKAKAPTPSAGYASGLKVLYTQNRAAGAGAAKVKSGRHIPSAPERILDAPELLDDYYLNLLDWGVAGLAIGLGPSVYLWNPATAAASMLYSTTAPDDHITSLSWIKEGGGYLAIGTAGADVLLWDVEKNKQVRRMTGHSARVSSLDWNGAQGHILSSGSRDSTIVNHDVRVKEHAVATLNGHTQEVCGLKWSPDGTMLASGGNDNLLHVWDSVASSASGEKAWTPKFRLTEHQAAVRALAWCPWQKGVLASGAGTADRCIKTWNASTGALLSSTDTGSQVSALAWNPHERELLSAHGFAQNQLSLWKYPTMTKVKDLMGHTARVLHLAASPDGSTVVSAGADESLRFWRVFGEARGKDEGAGGGGGPGAGAGGGAPSGLGGMTIR